MRKNRHFQENVKKNPKKLPGENNEQHAKWAETKLKIAKWQSWGGGGGGGVSIGEPPPPPGPNT